MYFALYYKDGFVVELFVSLPGEDNPFAFVPGELSVLPLAAGGDAPLALSVDDVLVLLLTTVGDDPEALARG